MENKKKDDNLLQQRVKLNVGGKKFETTVATIVNQGEDNFLAQLVLNHFQDRISSSIDTEGYIFIDRNPQIFAVILEFLRTGHIFEKSFNPQQIAIEFDYFDIKLPTNISMRQPSTTVAELWHPYQENAWKWFSENLLELEKIILFDLRLSLRSNQGFTATIFPAKKNSGRLKQRNSILVEEEIWGVATLTFVEILVASHFKCEAKMTLFTYDARLDMNFTPQQNPFLFRLKDEVK